MRVRTLFVASLASLACLAQSPASDARLASTGGTSVAFEAIGPAGMKIVGTASEVRVTEDTGTSSITVRVPLAQLTTGIALRDRHMREKYLEVGAYPDATLVVARGALRIPAAGASSEGSAPGVMTLHGRSHPVTVSYSAKRDGDRTHVSGGARLDVCDYGIAIPSYLGVSVKPEVDVRVTFDATDATP